MAQLTTLQASATKDSSYYTSGYDLSDYDSVVICLEVTNMSGTSPYVEVHLQHSMDNSTWHDMYGDFQTGNFKRIDSDSFSSYGTQCLFLEQFAKYVRAHVIIGGTSPEITLKLSANAF